MSSSPRSCVIGASYGYYWDYHISIYGEAILLAVQSAYQCNVAVVSDITFQLHNLTTATLCKQETTTVAQF